VTLIAKRSALTEENLVATPILNYESPEIRALADKVAKLATSERHFLQLAHKEIAGRVRPVYTVRELQSASETLKMGVGSCSQRLACLEAFARANHIPTRVTAYWISGKFWYPRFRSYRLFIPKRIMLVWPEFYVDESWLSADEIYASTADTFSHASSGFSNNDAETLFEAIDGTPIDFSGKAISCGCRNADLSLSRHVLGAAGIFATRDEAFSMRLGCSKGHSGGEHSNCCLGEDQPDFSKN
jgi:transglutaminase-like putative cysteine protease